MKKKDILAEINEIKDGIQIEKKLNKNRFYKKFNKMHKPLTRQIKEKKK